MSLIKPLKIVFAGTPDFSASVLQSLLAQGHTICAVYCQPDRRVGRGKKLAFGPVKQLAVSHDIPVEQPTKFDETTDSEGLTALERLANYQADLMIVVAYGLILPSQVLKTPKFGCVNIHASLLPRWRGAAPIQRAIEAGDSLSGITIMQMDEGLDTGNMLLKLDCPITALDTGSTLHDRLTVAGSQGINQFLNSFVESEGESNLAPGEVQDASLACYAHKLSKAEAEINWADSAVSIERKIRAFNAWPVSFTQVGTQRIRVWQARVVDESEYPETANITAGQILEISKTEIFVRCGTGVLALQQLQADGSRAMTVAELLNSKKSWFIDNQHLGSDLSKNS